MIRKAIRMKLLPGFEEEYQMRHDKLWPEMEEMLKEYGAITYSIFLDPETLSLFGYLEISDLEKWNQTATTEINQKWWLYMKDIMETNEDNSPVSVDLVEVFHLS